MHGAEDDSFNAFDLEWFCLSLYKLGLFLALCVYFYLLSEFGDNKAVAVLSELELYFLHAKRSKITSERVTELETLYFTLEVFLNFLNLL